METLNDAIKQLKDLENKGYEFVSTDTLGNFHLILTNAPEPELDNYYYMALFKDEGVGEDSQSVEGRDYEVIQVEILEQRIGKTDNGVLACFCKVKPVGKLPEWFDESDYNFAFDNVNISALCDNEYWTPVDVSLVNITEF